MRPAVWAASTWLSGGWWALRCCISRHSLHAETQHVIQQQADASGAQQAGSCRHDQRVAAGMLSDLTMGPAAH
jgi:hypothetical protein